MKRKFLAKAMLAALVAPLVLTACSGTDEAADGPVTLDYWMWDSAQMPGYEKCAAAFTAKNPNITVKLENYGWDDYWTKIAASFVGEAGPDLFANQVARYGAFAEQKQIVPLDEYIERDSFDVSVFQPGLIDVWKGEQGETYGLPKDWDTTAIFYNSGMLEAAGVTEEEINNLDWNLEDGGSFEKMIAKLTVDKNGVRGDEAGFDKDNIETYGMAASADYLHVGQAVHANFTGSLGWDYLDKNPWGTKYNMDDPDFQKTIEWYWGLADKGFMPKHGEFDVVAAEQFGSGRTAIAFEGSWMTSLFYNYEGVETGVAPAPVGPNGYRSSIMGSLTDAISATSKHKDEAWEFIKFMATPECQDLVAAEAVIFPSIPSSSEKAIEAFEAKGYNVAPFFTYLEEPNRTQTMPTTVKANQVAEMTTAAIEEIYMGTREASSLTELNDQVNALLTQ